MAFDYCTVFEAEEGLRLAWLLETGWSLYVTLASVNLPMEGEKLVEVVLGVGLLQ